MNTESFGNVALLDHMKLGVVVHTSTQPSGDGGRRNRSLGHPWLHEFKASESEAIRDIVSREKNSPEIPMKQWTHSQRHKSSPERGTLPVCVDQYLEEKHLGQLLLVSGCWFLPSMVLLGRILLGPLHLPSLSEIPVYRLCACPIFLAAPVPLTRWPFAFTSQSHLLIWLSYFQRSLSLFWIFPHLLLKPTASQPGSLCEICYPTYSQGIGSRDGDN